MKNEFSTEITTEDTYSRVLHEVCLEQGITLTELGDGWIKLVTRGAKRHFVVGYSIGLNNATSTALANSKSHTYQILTDAGIPAALHQVFYSPTNQEPYAEGYNSFERLTDFFEQHQHSIVLKPDGGATGRRVCHVTEIEQIEPALEQIFAPDYWHEGDPAGVMSPYYEIQHEYRVIMLDDEPKFIYQKSLTSQSDWKFNLSRGAHAEKVSRGPLFDELSALAKSAMRALTLRFASVDIIQLKSDELLVLEVNAGISVSGYLHQHPEDYPEIKAIFAEAMAKVFC